MKTNIWQISNVLVGHSNEYQQPIITSPFGFCQTLTDSQTCKSKPACSWSASATPGRTRSPSGHHMTVQWWKRDIYKSALPPDYSWWQSHPTMATSLDGGTHVTATSFASQTLWWAMAIPCDGQTLWWAMAIPCGGHTLWWPYPQLAKPCDDHILWWPILVMTLTFWWTNLLMTTLCDGQNLVMAKPCSDKTLW